MALQIGAIVTAISQLSISGVTVVDDNAIPPNVGDTGKLMLFPEPENFITDFSMEYQSTGAYTTALLVARYTLHYTYCHAPVGQGATGLDVFSDVVTKWGLICDAIMRNTLDEAVLIQIGEANILPVPDPMGNMYLGARFTILITEFVN